MEERIIGEIRELAEDNAPDLTRDAMLIGPDKALDSMTLVQLCLRLEDIAEEDGFAFDWSSEKAMSRSSSIFRTVASLAAEFERQRAEQTGAPDAAPMQARA